MGPLLSPCWDGSRPAHVRSRSPPAGSPPAAGIYIGPSKTHTRNFERVNRREVDRRPRPGSTWGTPGSPTDPLLASGVSGSSVDGAGRALAPSTVSLFVSLPRGKAPLRRRISVALQRAWGEIPSGHVRCQAPAMAEKESRQVPAELRTHSAPLSSSPPRCGSRGAPRSPARRGRGARSRGATWRSSRSSA
jgi:hypothetical protein